MSWPDYNMIKMNCENSVIKEHPSANVQLEQPIITADIQFNKRTYTFTDIFVIISETSFPIIGMNLMRNHEAVIDAANGTINFPHVKMTFAMVPDHSKC